MHIPVNGRSSKNFPTAKWSPMQSCAVGNNVGASRGMVGLTSDAATYSKGQCGMMVFRREVDSRSVDGEREEGGSGEVRRCYGAWRRGR
jgi:hypothetical protein